MIGRHRGYQGHRGRRRDANKSERDHRAMQKFPGRVFVLIIGPAPPPLSIPYDVTSDKRVWTIEERQTKRMKLVSA